MNEIDKIGSFILFKHDSSIGTVYTLLYTKEHRQIYSWQFLNNEKLAREFALRKTKIDRNLFKENP